MISLTFVGNNEEGINMVKEIFNKSYGVPLNIISVLKVSKCHSIDNRFLELCLNEKGELNEFSNYNIKKIINSLKVFSQRRIQ
jgi:hypothetical protein